MYSKQPSFWEREVFFNQIDILIIGSGLVGLLSALELRSKFPRKNIVIVERGALPSGASTKNAGFACFGSLSELIADLKESTFDEVVDLACRRYKGLQKLLSIVNRENIEYEECGGMEIFQKESEATFEKCFGMLESFNKAFQKRLGLPKVYQIADQLIEENDLNDISSIIKNQYEGKLNVGLLMQELLKKVKYADIQIYNGLEVTNVRSEAKNIKVVLHNGWEIESQKVLIANNAFAKKLIPDMDIKAVRNPVLITKPIENLKLRGTFHLHEGYIYFRNVKNRVLIGGARHLSKKEETTSEFGINPLLESHLMNLLKEMILADKSFEIETKWSGILGVGENKRPIVEKIDENLFVAVKMGGMGVAISSLIAAEVTALIN